MTEAAPHGLAVPICYPSQTATVNDYSPYAPPQHHHASPYGGGYNPYVYQPLGWRTTVSIVGVIGTVLFSFLQTGASLAFPDILKHPEPGDLGIILALGLLGLVVSAVSVVTWVFFLIWMHQAAKNVRALGQQGLGYTPGWCVGWWFVPIMSLWKPFDAMREIWKASDPDSVGPGATKPWQASAVPPALAAWWGVYIVNGFVGMGIVLSNLDLSGKKAAVTAGPANFVTHALLGVAGVFLVIVMRKLAQRQGAAFQRLQSAPADPAGPYGAPGPMANPYM